MTARPGPGTPGSVVYATDHRRGLGAFMAPGSATDPLATRSGIVHAPGSPLRVRQNTPLGMTALVNPGNTEIHRPGRGTYTPYNDAVATVAFDPAPASNSRYDLVYIAQNDSDVDASSTTPLAVIKGDATAAAPKPYGQVPAGGLVLAEVGPIAVGTTQITDALIKNVAPLAAVRGAPVPVRSQAERDDLNAIASATYPVMVERLDTGALERNAGAGWVVVSPIPAPPTPPARGVLGSAVREAPVTTAITTEVIVSDFNLTLEADGLTYWLEFSSHLQATVGDDRLSVVIRRGTAATDPVVGNFIFILGRAAVPVSVGQRTRDTPPAGPVTYTTWVSRAGGTGTVTIPAAADRPIILTASR